MNKAIALTTLAFSLALGGQAQAHGSKAKHGGIVQSSGDLSFELVSKDGVATIYVDDHGKDLATAGMSGSLTVLQGASKSVLPLAASGANTLVAKGVSLARGNKAVASVTFANKDVVSVRFSVK
ncbi:hypothetical protein [Massilia sp. TWR1-2-2]|uniref:hypothetical protein n=1 Tax=Massilia sp. TWR1-2-2 TaxID=2804584 RepID=UPI003CEF4D5D